MPSAAVVEAAGHVLTTWSRIGWQPVEQARLARSAARAGVPRVHTEDALELIAACGMATEREGVYYATQGGRAVGEDLTAGVWLSLAMTLLSSGPLRAQAARLLSIADFRDGQLVVPSSRAAELAPQATVILSWLGAPTGGWVVVPTELLPATLLVEPDSAPPDWVTEQVRAGRRAEVYSVVRERLRNPSARVLHVSLERDNAGYDIEVNDRSGQRYVEVKASRSSRLAFYFTANEMAEAARRLQAYEIQFWGELDLSKSPDQEFGELTARGYPRVLPDPTTLIDQGRLVAIPTEFRVEEPTAVPPIDSSAGR